MTNKTRPTSVSIEEYLSTVTPPKRAQDARVLLDLFQEVSGYAPRMWGESIIGFGQYHYRYESGREGVFLATGFAPRKAQMVVYIMPGYQDYSAILKDLGPHRLGKSCLYLGAFSKIDLDVLRRLIATGLEDLNKIWPVTSGE
jgi:hypothetical protein